MSRDFRRTLRELVRHRGLQMSAHPPSSASGRNKLVSSRRAVASASCACKQYLRPGRIQRIPQQRQVDELLEVVSMGIYDPLHADERELEPLEQRKVKRRGCTYCHCSYIRSHAYSPMQLLFPLNPQTSSTTPASLSPMQPSPKHVA